MRYHFSHRDYFFNLIFMKNYKLFNVGDVVEILHSHSDDKGKIGKIVEVRPSFCKIEIEGYSKPKNHTYGQFKKIQ